MLANSAAQAKSAGIKVIPQIEAANALGTLIADLQKQRTALGKVIDKAEAHARRHGEAGGVLDVGWSRCDGRGAKVLRRASSCR